MTLDRAPQRRRSRKSRRPLGLESIVRPHAIVASPPKTWSQAIVDITVNQGMDPREAVLVGGGGAAGLNSVRIARRLGRSA